MAQRNTPPNFKSFFESVTIDASGSLIVSTLSASYASSSGAGFPYIGFAEVTGSMDISENLIVRGTASFSHLQYETSSIITVSGSTKFGDTQDDTHQYTGSLLIQGNTTMSGGLAVQGGISTDINILFPATQVRWVPTQSINGPGLSVQVWSSSSGTPRWEEIGYFAE